MITAGFADLFAGVVALSIAANFLGIKRFLDDREGLCNVRGGISFDLLLLLNEDSEEEHELGRSDKDWRADSNSRSRSMNSCSFSSRSLDVLITKSLILLQDENSECSEIEDSVMILFLKASILKSILHNSLCSKSKR